MDSGYINKQMYKEGEITRRSNLKSSISPRGYSIDNVFVEYPASQKVMTINHFNDDETIDARAASYISCVQERFRLERVTGAAS